MSRTAELARDRAVEEKLVQLGSCSPVGSFTLMILVTNQTEW